MVKTASAHSRAEAHLLAQTADLSRPRVQQTVVPSTDAITTGSRIAPAASSVISANEVVAKVGTPITGDETKRLAECESRIETGCKSLFAAGEALRTIRDERLYRGAFRNFEDYCHTRWDFSRVSAHYQIRAAETRLLLLTVVNEERLPEPKNERQLRPLTRLQPDQKRAAWKQACEIAGNSEITHRHVEQAVAAITGEIPERKRKKQGKKADVETLTARPNQSGDTCDNPVGDSCETKTDCGKSGTDPIDEEPVAKYDNVDEEIVSAVSDRIGTYVLEQITGLSTLEKARVADELRSLAGEICK